jgi:hypothetical protein
VGGASIFWAEVRLPAARGVHSLQAPSRSEAHHCCAWAAARKQLFGGVGLTGFAEFARKVRLHPPFHWEMIAGHTLSQTNLVSSISNVQNLDWSISREARFGPAPGDTCIPAEAGAAAEGFRRGDLEFMAIRETGARETGAQISRRCLIGRIS